MFTITLYNILYKSQYFLKKKQHPYIGAVFASKRCDSCQLSIVNSLGIQVSNLDLTFLPLSA